MSKICDVCGELITKDWPDRHDYHEPDCPNFVDFTKAEADSYGPCECNLIAHPDCCPQCNPKETEKLA